MDRKKKAQLKIWFIAGSCGLVAVGMLGVTFPKMGRLDELKKQWAEMEPIASRVITFEDNDEGTVKPVFQQGQDPRTLLPEDERSALEFYHLVRRASMESGIPHSAFLTFKLDKSSNWPAALAIPSGPPSGEKPLEYQETPNFADPPSRVRRHILRMSFYCEFQALMKLCDKLRNIPRFSQICSITLRRDPNAGLDKNVGAEIVLETFTLASAP